MKIRCETIFIAILVITNVCEVQPQTPITCTAGYYKPGDTATITCDYHGDINTADNSGVYVQWRELQTSRDSSGIEVLTCGFTRRVLEGCNPEDGYRFVSFEDTKLIVQIPFVETKFQGRYSCGVVSSSGSGPERPMRQCLLVVEGALDERNTAEKADDNAGRQGTLHKHDETTRVVAITNLIITIVMLAAAAGIYMVVAHKKNLFPFSLCRTQGDVEYTEQLPEPDRSGTMIVAYKPVRQATREDDHPYKNDTAPPQGTPSNPSNEREPMLRASHNQSDSIGMEEKAEEKKIETKEERKARLEKEDKERKAELEKYLRKATTKEEKYQIKKQYGEYEKAVKEKRKEEEKHWKEQLKKKEEERVKREKK